jgi:hypothetical protein
MMGVRCVSPHRTLPTDQRTMSRSERNNIGATLRVWTLRSICPLSSSCLDQWSGRRGRTRDLLLGKYFELSAVRPRSRGRA